MKIWISGACGHMGRAVAEMAAADGIEVLGGIDRAGDHAAFPVYRDFASLPAGGDAVIDFSVPAALTDLLAWCESEKLPAVICTTGFTPEQVERIREASARIPIFRSGNMSLGIALIRKLAREAAAVLGERFDIEIVEAHHRRKVDAPSGTALMLYDAVKNARGTDAPCVMGRAGRDSKRSPGEIGLHAIRGGTVVGEHEVLFLGESERISIRHSAESRSVFAAGALRAAAFLVGKAPGLYDMDDLLADELNCD